MAYTKIATISTDPHHTSQEFRASVGAQWPFLEDPERLVQKDLDIQEYTDPDNDPMIPHTLVLKPGLVIHSIYNRYWFWGRPSPEDLRHDLRAVTPEIHHDWDLSIPRLRDAWTPATFRGSMAGTGGVVAKRWSLSLLRPKRLVGYSANPGKAPYKRHFDGDR